MRLVFYDRYLCYSRLSVIINADLCMFFISLIFEPFQRHLWFLNVLIILVLKINGFYYSKFSISFILIVTVQPSLPLLTTITSAYLQVYLTFHFDRLNQRPLNKEESLHHSVVTSRNVTRSKENKVKNLTSLQSVPRCFSNL